MRLSGKTAIVTGGASGFGEGIVRKFAGEGARVVVLDRHGARAKTLEAELGTSVAALVGDVTKAPDFAQAVDLAKRRFARLDILVNIAGVCHTPQPLEDLGRE